MPAPMPALLRSACLPVSGTPALRAEPEAGK